MKHKSLATGFKFVVLVVLITARVNAGEVEDGCLACHAVSVENSEQQGPLLGGFKAHYIENQMRNFLQGRRGSGSPLARVMASAVSQVSDGDIEKIAKWAASLPDRKTFKFKIVENDPGSSLFADKCRGCHKSFMGKLMTGSPRLDYLSPEYIVEQLHLYRQGLRHIENPNKHQEKMKIVAKELTDQQILDLKHFLNESRL